MRILVTGAAGYIGSALVRSLARLPGAEIVASDQAALDFGLPNVEAVTGNLAYPQFARGLVTAETGAVFHLASLVSGGAEQSFELGTKVNLDASRDLMEACRLSGGKPRFLFASSIAVYGGAAEITDATPPAPRLSYGAQKLACEILIDDYSRRGFLDGCSLRLPAVIVRPGSANTAVSGWASAVVREPLAGRDYVCPVAPGTRLACISLGRVLEAFLHAFHIHMEGSRRTVLLPGIGASAGELWDAVKGRAKGQVRFQPDPALQKLMDAAPKSTSSEKAARLGFRGNRDVAEIVEEYEKNHPDPALSRHG